MRWWPFITLATTTATAIFLLARMINHRATRVLRSIDSKYIPSDVAKFILRFAIYIAITIALIVTLFKEGYEQKVDRTLQIEVIGISVIAAAISMTFISAFFDWLRLRSRSSEASERPWIRHQKLVFQFFRRPSVSLCISLFGVYSLLDTLARAFTVLLSR